MTGTAIDPRDLRGQRELAQQDDLAARQQLHETVDDVKWQMSGPRGRRVKWKELVDCGVLRPHNGSWIIGPFEDGRVGNTNDFIARAARQGPALAFALLAMQHCSEQWRLMLEENVPRREENS